MLLCEHKVRVSDKENMKTKERRKLEAGDRCREKNIKICTLSPK